MHFTVYTLFIRCFLRQPFVFTFLLLFLRFSTLRVSSMLLNRLCRGIHAGRSPYYIRQLLQSFGNIGAFDKWYLQIFTFKSMVIVMRFHNDESIMLFDLKRKCLFFSICCSFWLKKVTSIIITLNQQEVVLPFVKCEFRTLHHANYSLQNDLIFVCLLQFLYWFLNSFGHPNNKSFLWSNAYNIYENLRRIVVKEQQSSTISSCF